MYHIIQYDTKRPKYCESCRICYICYYLDPHLKTVKKSGIRQVSRFANVFRFIDALTALKYGRNFEWNFKENVSNNEGFLLDLLKVQNNQFSVQLYEKKDDFLFSILRMPNLKSNMPSKMFYST